MYARHPIRSSVFSCPPLTLFFFFFVSMQKCVTALEKTWHTEHFFCAQCGKQFGEEGFHERDGKPYCRDDYFDMFAPKCGGCNRAIMENYISALNSQWHPDCFVCRVGKRGETLLGLLFFFPLDSSFRPSAVGKRRRVAPLNSHRPREKRSSELFNGLSR